MARLPEAIKAYGKAHWSTYKKIYSLIKKYDRICVFRHIKPDFDAYGSQMGLVTFIKDNFPNKEVRYVGDNHVSFAGRVYPVSESLPESWFETPFLAIVCDVGEPERIADPRYAKATDIVKIDHHPCRSEITDVKVVDLDSASASEMVYDLCINWKGKKVSYQASWYFYSGIVGDTGNFKYRSTSIHTFACAEKLMETGIVISDITNCMFQKKIDDLKVTAYVLGHFNVTEHGVAYYYLPETVQTELNITSERGKDNVNLFANIEGIEAWCSFSESTKDNCWWVSIRSRKEDISQVAAKWRGGGHANASGARIFESSEMEALVKDLDDLFVKGE